MRNLEILAHSSQQNSADLEQAFKYSSMFLLDLLADNWTLSKDKILQEVRLDYVHMSLDCVLVREREKGRLSIARIGLRL